MTSGNLFSTVHREDVLSLFQGNKPDYEKVVGLLDLKKKDVAKASNVSVDSIRYDARIPKELEGRLTEWANAMALVGQYFQDAQKAVLWFKIPNPLLGNVTPRDMIRIGRFAKLLKFIQLALNENMK